MEYSIRSLLQRTIVLIVSILGVIATLLAFQNVPQWVILIAAFVSIIAAIAVFYPFLITFIARRDKLIWFINRNDATPDMQREMERHDTLVFIGISQVTLAEYLRPSLDKICRGQGTKWKYVSIYFADDDNGRSWEGPRFKENLRVARQEIAQTLCDKDFSMMSLENISFRQCDQALGYGGSIFGKTTNGKRELDVIYNVNYLPSTNGDTKKALTAKITRTSNKRRDLRHQQPFDIYRDAFDVLESSSVKLGDFTPSIWDWSGMEWQDYCEKHAGTDKSIRELLLLAELNGTENVLDIGGGTGEPAKHILAQLPYGKLTLLEASPGMLSFAKRLLGGDSRVRFALCRLFDKLETELDIQDQKYDVIFCHQSLASIATNPDALSYFARWCKTYLVQGGSVVLNAHNGVLNINPASGYEHWNDPFRSTLLDILTKNNIELRSQNPLRLELGYIEDAFSQSGYSIIGNGGIPKQIEISMSDRALMWRVPAIMDSLIDVRKIGIPKAQSIIEEVTNAVRQRDTMPRTILSWKFTLPK